MNILTTFLLLLSISFNAIETETNQDIIKIENPDTNNGFIITDKDYTLHFEIEKTNDQKYNLVLTVELHNEAYYISPSAKGDFSGKFNLDLGSYTDLGFEGKILETPVYVTEYNQLLYSDDNVQWVRVNTMYKQLLQIKSKEDFEVFGRVQFTIEPRCTFEEIPFAISYKNGVVKVTYPKC